MEQLGPIKIEDLNKIHNLIEDVRFECLSRSGIIYDYTEGVYTLLMNNIINAVSSTKAWKIIENLYSEAERIELI